MQSYYWWELNRYNFPEGKCGSVYWEYGIGNWKQRVTLKMIIHIQWYLATLLTQASDAHHSLCLAASGKNLR
jgi:hypothetical protein